MRCENADFGCEESDGERAAERLCPARFALGCSRIEGIPTISDDRADLFRGNAAFCESSGRRVPGAITRGSVSKDLVPW